MAGGHHEVVVSEVEGLERRVHQRQQLGVVAPGAGDAVQERRVHGAAGQQLRPLRGIVDRGEDIGGPEQVEDLEDDLLRAAGDREPVVHERGTREVV
jgi:hypothetical protein